jgi:hypothetical protein
MRVGPFSNTSMIKMCKSIYISTGDNLGLSSKGALHHGKVIRKVALSSKCHYRWPWLSDGEFPEKDYTTIIRKKIVLF